METGWMVCPGAAGEGRECVVGRELQFCKTNGVGGRRAAISATRGCAPCGTLGGVVGMAAMCCACYHN